MSTPMRRVNEVMSSKMGNYLTNFKSWNPVTYNVLEYDVVGGGITDDTEALQALVDLAISEGRKAIYFPHGEYYVTSLSNADQVVFFGDNASFVGGYTGTIYQMGDWATNEQLADIATTPQAFGAAGDGVADDTPAFELMTAYVNQYARVYIDLGRHAYKLTKPTSEIYPSTAGFVFTSNWVKMSGDGAKIIIPDGENYEVFWFLGDGANYTDEDTYISELHYDNSNDYAEVSGVTFDFGTSGTGVEKATRFRYIKNAAFNRNSVLASNGNGVNFEQCASIECKFNSLSSYNQYGVFAWMVGKGEITDNLIDGGGISSRGIVVKHNYHAQKHSGLKVRNNTIVNVVNYGISSGDTLESGEAVYEAGHEKVWGVEFAENRIFIPSGGFSNGGLWLGQFTHGWRVHGNRFIATDSAAATNIIILNGSTADADQGDAGDRLADHSIDRNEIYGVDATSSAIISVRAKCFFSRNRFVECKGACYYMPQVTYADGNFSAPGFDSTDDEFVDCEVTDNNFDAIVYTVNVPVIRMLNARIYRLTMSVTNSYFFRQTGSTAADIDLTGIYLDGLSGTVTLAVIAITSLNSKVTCRKATVKNLTVAATSVQLLRGDSSVINIGNLDVDFTGNSSTNRNLVFASSNVGALNDDGGNRPVNETAIFNTQSAILSRGINTSQRIFYGSATPTAGTYRRGDVMYYLAPSASGKVGEVCVTAGSPGTWKTFGTIDA